MLRFTLLHLKPQKYNDNSRKSKKKFVYLQPDASLDTSNA